MEREGANLEDEVTGLGMFVGDFNHSLDPKKRLTIPSVWRAQVGSPRTLYVLPDFHQPCLTAYPASEMVRKLESLRQYSMADKTAREFSRILGGSSELVAWDSQGRIRINDKLLDFAGLTDRVVMIGALDRIELWSPERQALIGPLNQERLRSVGEQVEF